MKSMHLLMLSLVIIFPPSYACEIPSIINAPCDEYGNTQLHKACMISQTITIENLIKDGANIEVENNWGRTPLFYACSKYTVENAKLLLAKGAQVNIKDTKYGETPLHNAVWFGETLACVKLLLEHNADVNAINNNRKTPRMLAEEIELKDQEVLDIINLLKEYETKQKSTNTKD